MTAKLTFIIGCTGCGKGNVGRELARRTGSHIISMDSMKVYRRMNVGTAKPSLEVREEIPHHLIDVLEPSEEFSVAQYVDQADRVIAELQSQKKSILVVGGTPLYLKALTEGLFESPAADETIRKKLHSVANQEGTGTLFSRLQEVDATAAERIHPNDLRRIVRALEVYELTGQPISKLQTQWDKSQLRYDILLIGLRRERDEQSHRTNQRVKRMIDSGLEGEVRNLLAESLPMSQTAKRAVGYAEMIRYLESELSLDQAIELIKINTRQLAKAQRTWFKRFLDIEWIDLSESTETTEVVDHLMERWGVVWLP